jgi:hypothetical protein
MPKLPQTRPSQAGLSFGVAVLGAIIAFMITNNVAFSRLVREYPRDGQDGLGALMIAIEAAFIAFFGLFIVLYLAQRALTEWRR